jgi:dihydrofolate synthase/folylpolyglutamate synthase
LLGPSGLSSSSSLSTWLAWQEQCHKQEIDLGLKRVASVYERLAKNHSKAYTITIAGTNGKGSSVAFLESILMSAGYKVGAYTTPHLLKYNERIRLNGAPIDDQRIVSSFDAIDQVREGTSLSYFEFGTLAAIDIFAKEKVDIQLLEVGLGGRLDAVNVIDADAVLVTSIDIDHTDWLGTDKSKIALEKAGVFRSNQKAVCSDASVPYSLPEYAHKIKTNLLIAGEDFNSSYNQNGWHLEATHKFSGNYPIPAFRGRHQINNAAGVVSLLAHIGDDISVNVTDIYQGLVSAKIMGRTQMVADQPIIIFDVAHNAESSQALAEYISSTEYTGSTYAVFSALADKDIQAVLEPFNGLVNYWYIAPLDAQRAEKIATIKNYLKDVSKPRVFESVKEAYLEAKNSANKNDLIVCFGSFYLVEACLREL